MDMKTKLLRGSEENPLNGCWVWQGALSSDGHGNVKDANNMATPAHKAAYEAWVGPVPDGMHVDHLCRNKACINPAHLEVVPPAVNALRYHRGPNSPL